MSKTFDEFIEIGRKAADVTYGPGPVTEDGTTTKTVNWYDGGLTVSIGGTTSVPILGTVYAEAIAGPVMNFSTRTLYQEEFANFSKSWDLGSGWTLAVFGGTGYFSKYQDQAAFDGGLNVTKRF